MKTILAQVKPFGFESCFVRINKNSEISLEGIYTNHVKGPQVFKKSFRIGDWAEYDSYNLKYNGKIVSIGEKTVTIQHDRCTERSRLNLKDFAWRNWDFDLEKSAKENSETMNCL